jgi:hypothetical protein
MSVSQNTMIWDRLGRMGLAARCCLLSGMALIAWTISAPLAYSTRGSTGLIAAAVAAGVCWFGAVVTLPVASLLRGPTAMMYGVALTMLARTMLPLMLGVALHFSLPSLAKGGMIYYLLAFYLIMLAVETVLSVARIPHSTSSQKAI